MPGSIDCEPNDGYPNTGGDKNSVGLYQQRQPWWGDIAGSMNPTTATLRFLTAMIANCPDWQTADEAIICQQVQQSQFDGITIDPFTNRPYPYAENYRARTIQVDALVIDPNYFTNRAA